MQVGTFKQHTDPKTSRKGFSGDAQLIGFLDGKVRLDPHPNYVPGKSDPEKHPQFTVAYQPRGAATFYEVGAGWMKAMRDGGEFVSITMDVPAWDKPLNLSLFPPSKERNEVDWRLQWSRPRGGEQEQQAAA